MDQLPVMIIGFPVEIDSGDFCAVLDLGGNKVAKVPLDYDCTTPEMLIREAEIAEKLYYAGILVPKPYGVHHLQGSHFTGTGLVIPSHIGLVMDKLEGTRGDKVPKKLKSRVENLFHNEVRKAEQAGFNHKDTALYNTIYDTKEDTLFLIDFDGWHVDEEKLFKYHNSLS